MARKKAVSPAPAPEPGLGVAFGIWLAGPLLALVFWEGGITVYTLPKVAALAFGILLSAAAAALGAGRLDLSGTALDAPLAVGACAYALSAVFSRDKFPSLIGNYNSYAHGSWCAAMLAALFYLSAWGLAGQRRRQTAWAAAAAGTAVALYAAFQSAGVEPFPEIAHLVDNRAIAWSGSPISLGAYLALVFPLVVHFMVAEKNRGFGAVCAASVVAGLAASITRASWACAALGALCYLWLTGRIFAPNWSRKQWAAASAAATGLVMVFLLALARRGRLDPFTSDAARTEVWRTAWIGFRHAPGLGNGPDTMELIFRKFRTLGYVRIRAGFEYQNHAHNDLLQVLATLGALGLAAYLFLIYRIAGAVRSALLGPERSLSAAFASGLLALFINMKVNPAPIEALAPAAVFCGLLCRLAPPVPGAKAASGKWLLRALLALAVVSVLAAARLVSADAWIKSAQLDGAQPERARRDYETALERNPCETAYELQYVNFIFQMAERSPDAAAKAGWISRGTDAARRVLACRPNFPIAHYALGALLAYRAGMGDGAALGESERELDRALEGDPLFDELLARRLYVAQLRGDAAKAAEFSRRLTSERRLSGR